MVARKSADTLQKGSTHVESSAWVAVLAVCLVTTWAGAGSATSPSLDAQMIEGLPLFFVENQGQVDEAVAYYLQGSGTAVYFTDAGLTYVLEDSGARESSSVGAVRVPSRWAVKLEFVGATPRRPYAESPRPTRINYLRGPRDNWASGVKTCGRVVYRDLWPGIDLEYEATASRLKYVFRVKPGADPSLIRFGYRGTTAAAVSDDAELVLETPFAKLTDEQPYAFQEAALGSTRVDASWARRQTDSIDRVDFGFEVGGYDRERVLVLDPATLVFCGYIGGLGSDSIRGVALDDSGNVYVTGSTDSSQTSFPVVAGPDWSLSGDFDAFVAKIRADGTALEYCGYIGGTGDEEGRDIAVDAAGCAYVAGMTDSTEASFPVAVGPDLTYNDGGLAWDGFIVKVRADGTGLHYGGYIGGSDGDEVWGLAVDDLGAAYVAGDTLSTEATFPVVVGPYLTLDGLEEDAFVAKVVPDGTGLQYCGYIGGSDRDSARSIAVDGLGRAVVAGRTASTEGPLSNFPVTVGPDITYNGGFWDSFVARVAANGTTLEYCGYIGGDSDDQGWAVDVDSLGRAYVAGSTWSTEATFPVAVGPDLSHWPSGEEDAFVARVRENGAGLEYCGYIGGQWKDEAYGIAVDEAYHAHVGGITLSSSETFPVVGGPDLTYNGSGERDAFVARIWANGGGLEYCGYIGGDGGIPGDVIYDVAVDPSGELAVGGYTQSTETTFPVTVGPDTTHNGGTHDAFVAKVSGPDPIFWDDFETGDLSRW